MAPVDVFYDFEFLEHEVTLWSEDQSRKVMTIEPISIGIKVRRGPSYYAVFRDAPWADVARSPFLMEQVVPKLPQFSSQQLLDAAPGNWLFDLGHRDVKPREQIAVEVSSLLLAAYRSAPAFAFPHLRLWADYGAFDHVSLAWLWGPMKDLPPHVPMFTNDLQQYADSVGVAESEFPKQDPATAHHAGYDAAHDEIVFDFLEARRDDCGC